MSLSRLDVLVPLSLGVLLASADLAITLWMVTSVGMWEDNPLALAILRFGVWATIGFKAAATAILVASILFMRSPRMRRVVAWGAALVMSLVLVRWHEYLRFAATDESLLAAQFAVDHPEESPWFVRLG